MTASESPLSRTERETGGGDAWGREGGGEETIDSAWAPPPMNDCTLVISAAERVTTAGGCRSSGANGSLRSTLRGGRASAGSQASATPLSPPVPSSTITITEGEPAVKLRQRTAPRSVVSVPLASASHSVKRAVPPCTAPAVFTTTRPIG